MSAPVAGDVAHQIVIDAGPDGSSVLSSSLASAAEEGFWLAALRDRAVFPEAAGLPRPPQAWSFVQLRNGGAAIVQRSERRHARALVARGRVLTTEMALGLDRWPGWSGAGDGALTAVAESDLQRYVDGAIEHLRDRAAALRPSLTALLAAVLGRWTSPLTVVGCPDPDRVPIVWALREIGRRRRERRAMRQWSFSTYELDDDDPVGVAPFEIVFLPARPDEDNGRMIVDLSRFARADATVGPAELAQASGALDALLGTASPLRTEYVPAAPSRPDAAPVAPPRTESVPVAAPRPPTPPLQPAPPLGHAPERPARFIRTVRCPTCADEFPWMDDGTVAVLDEGTGGYELLDIDGWDSVKQSDVLRRGYRRCPNPSDDTPEHYLPATYADYEEPLAIGLVGQTSSGKTHLLTAMIREAHRGGLQPFGVRTTSLDFVRHAAFRSRFIEPLERGERLEGTGTDIFDAADILLLRGPGGEYPVTFFDVAGEDLVRHDVQGRAARFLLALNAVIFVHAPEDTVQGQMGSGENVAFDLAVERIVATGASVPASIVLTKSDRLRYVPPADRWLRRGAERDLSAERMRAESRDVFAYLHDTGSTAALNPFPEFPRCTLHFVSASGRDATSGGMESRFEGGIRPARVLEPLIAILAMTGVLTGPEADKVGVP